MSKGAAFTELPESKKIKQLMNGKKTQNHRDSIWNGNIDLKTLRLYTEWKYRLENIA